MRTFTEDSSAGSPWAAWGQYAKAGLVFAATTATYFFAKATGVLPSWFQGETPAETAMTAPESTAIIVKEDDAIRINLDTVHALADDFSIPDLSLTDFNEIDLRSVSSLTSESSRHTLLDVSPVIIVAHPVPDQVIEASQEYHYSLDKVFSGKFTLLKTMETGEEELPSWLKFEYETIDSVSWGGNIYISRLYFQNDLFFALDVSCGFYTLNISDTNDLQLISIYNTSSLGIKASGSQSMAFKDNMAFIGSTSSSLEVVDISNIFNPRWLSSYPLLMNAEDIAIQGDFAFIASTQGLFILNISNPLIPSLYNTYASLNFYAFKVVLQDQIAFIAGYNPHLQILNISDLSNLSIINSYDLPSGGGIFCIDLIVNNNIMFLGYNSYGVQSLNISDFTNVTEIDFYRMAVNGISNIDFQENNGILLATIPIYGVYVIDVKTTYHMNLLNVYQFPSNPEVPGLTWDISVKENIALVSGGPAGVAAFDFSKGQLIGAPSQVSAGTIIPIMLEAWDNFTSLASDSFQLTIDRLPRRVEATLLDQSVFPEGTLSLFLKSDLLFSNPNQVFLELYSTLVDNKPLPVWMNLKITPISINAFPSLSYCLVIRDNKLLVQTYMPSMGKDSLQIFDTTNPEELVLLSTYYAFDRINSIGLNGTTVFLLEATANVIEILDISEPQNPSLINIFSLASPAAISIQNNMAFVASYSKGLQVVNMTDLLNPQVVGNYSTPNAQTITVQANIAAMTDLADGFEWFNISDLAHPGLLSNAYPYGIGTAGGVVLRNNIAFSAASGGLYIFDISDVTAPQLISRCCTDISLSPMLRSFDVQGSLAVLGDMTYGLQFISFRNFTYPKIIGSYYSPGSFTQIWGLGIQGNKAFVIDNSGAAGLLLKTLDISQWQLTAQPTAADVGNYKVKITAADPLGGEASSTFTIRVEGPPQIHDVIPTQYAKVNQAFNYFIPQGLITDPNFDALIFNATLSDGLSLPSWLQFNSISATFSGTPQNADIGNYTVLFSVTDNIAGQVNTTFSLQVNDVPVLIQVIPTQLANIGLPYQWILPTNTFSNPNGGELIYLAQQSNGLALPAWLHFNTTLREFTGFAQSSDAGSYGLTVVAIDRYEGQATAMFTLLVEYLPSVNQLVVSPFAGIEAPFIYPIPANAFTDANGNTLTYSATRENGALLPNWLSFNPQTLVFSGTPLATDAGVVSILLTAASPSGGQAQQNFNVTVTYFPRVVVPIPTQLTDVNSYNVLTLPSNTFVDEDNSVLIYSAQWSGHTNLPTWLQFNAVLLQFVGMPNRTDVGQYQLTVNATDTYGASTGTVLTWIVDSFPRLNQPLSKQLAGVELPYTFTIPANTFIDEDEDLLTYQVQSMSGAALPNWLSFNPQTLVLAGVPQVTDLGDLFLQLLTTDSVGGRGQQNFNLSIIYFPFVAAAIPAQLADIGGPYQFTVPADTFQYAGGTQSLTYSARQNGGLPLPDWLQFNSIQLQFYGMVNVSSAGSLRLEVIAATEQGGQATATFSLRMEHFPRVNHLLSAQLAGVDIPWTLALPSNTFSDADDDLLVYQVSQIDGMLLPNWLSFNSASLTFSGVPRVTDLGELYLRLRATDPDGAWAEQDFNLTVVYFPQLLHPVSDQLAGVDLSYQFTLPPNTFQDPNNQVLLYSAHQQSGTDLPTWLNFDTAALRFTGFPNATAVGNYPLKVIAVNPQGAIAAAEFALQVEYFPRLQRVIDDQWAGVGFAFSFTLPENTFVDEEDNLLTYQASLVDHSPLPNWLSFNRQSLTFLGVPLETNFGSIFLNVTAADSQGASVQTNFTINVVHFPAVAIAIPPPPILHPELLWTMTVPNVTFSDPDYLIQSYEATTSDGTPLPAWLQFNDSTLIFSGTPGESDVGTVDVLVVAQAAHQLRAIAPFSITVSINLPPRLAKPISDQTATVDEPFNFFISADTFVDPEGETLTYSAERLGESNLPEWLHFNKDNLNFWGTPQPSDTDTYSARIIRVALTAQDGQSQARTTFNINVLGSSNWVLAIKILAPLISVLSAVLAGYRQRAICLNRINKRRYQRLQQTVAAGEVFQHPLSTPAAHIGRIEVKLWRPTNDCCRLFRSQQRGLPGNALLPSWMEYDTDTNTLRSKGVVPAGIMQNLIIEVKNSGGVILEQFKLIVNAHPETENEPSQILSASGEDDRSIALETPRSLTLGQLS